MDHYKTDEGLQGNETIEVAIEALQKEPSQELLAHALTVIRRRMNENGQLIIAVDAPTADGQMKIQAIEIDDGTLWWSAFTSFEEELKGSGSVMSTFLADIEQLLHMAIREESVSGIILNPWNRTLMMDKLLIQIVLGEHT